MLSAEETAERLGISLCTLYRRWREWGLRGHYIGRQLKFRERDVESYIDSRVG